MVTTAGTLAQATFRIHDSDLFSLMFLSLYGVVITVGRMLPQKPNDSVKKTQRATIKIWHYQAFRNRQLLR